MEVFRSHRDRGVAENLRDADKVRAELKSPARKRVPEVVEAEPGDARVLLAARFHHVAFLATPFQFLGLDASQAVQRATTHFIAGHRVLESSRITRVALTVDCFCVHNAWRGELKKRCPIAPSFP